MTGPRRDVTKTNASVLEAMLDMPLGTSLRQLAEKIGKHVNTVEHHAHRLKRLGKVQELRPRRRARSIWVPASLRLSPEEREWLALGTTTLRVLLVVKRAGRRVTSREVAQTLGWKFTTAAAHLQRARTAGFLETQGGRGGGYALACMCERDREKALLGPRTLEAVAFVATKRDRVTIDELAEAKEWTRKCAAYHLAKGVQAGLLVARNGWQGGYYATSRMGESINWAKSNTGASA